MTPVLYQFPFSHYNEKARWALDLKAVPHRRITVPPGAHVPILLAISGQRQTPTIKTKDGVIPGSAQVIDYLEREYPEPALYPTDPDQLKQAMELQTWFDDELGPAVRRALFFDVLTDPLYTSRIFGSGLPFGKFFYLGTYPLFAGFLTLQEKVTPAQAKTSRGVTTKALDLVAEKAGDGYLVGDQFTVADLTAASLLAVAVLPPEFQYPGRNPEPKSLRAWASRWSDHPGAEYIRRMWRLHRGESSEITGKAA